MINILLCGGSGTRLWPISRGHYPKQFCNLIGDKSLFQETLLRNRIICRKSVVVTNEEHYFLSKMQAEEINTINTEFILEPIGRNTAPAITLACLSLNEDDIVLISPTDHYIKNLSNYEKIMIRAKELAKADYLVTFGIKPTHPETGYGYIEADGENVISFCEKPNEKTAQEYIEKGNYFWNSGMFVFKVRTFLSEIKHYSEDIFDASSVAFQNRETNKNITKIPQGFMEKIPSNSIDYAVMEKSNRIKILTADIEWSDLGGFEAMYDILEHDTNGNVSTKKDILHESKNNLIISGERPIVLIDAADLVVADTHDAILISKKGSSHKIRDVIDKLETISPNITKAHSTVYRPWGSYAVLESSHRYKIKKILVKPGCSLSLQKHFHRSEHWTIVAGTATVDIGEKEITLCTNESVYIPMGEVHRLGNPGKIDLIIIETSTGDYIEEDDIVRYEDTYGRL